MGFASLVGARRGGGRTIATDLASKGRRVNFALMLELEEEPIAPFARELGGEGHRPRLVARGMNMQVGEVALAQRHEMAASAQVGLNLDLLSLATDAEAQLGLAPSLAVGALHADLVAVRGAGHVGGR